ncbi:MAG: hypothetical protein K2G31_04620, partial [Clostridia bacterium]|nr:hypothetical protein [Clostridia bacterium]
IREWLNGEFYQKAFGYYEKQLFADGKDKVRLLTLSELEEFKVNSFSDVKRPTDYAKAKGCEVCFVRKSDEYSGSGWWWLQDSARKLLYEQARIAGMPKIELPSTGNKERDIETLFFENDIELLKISDEEKAVQSSEGGVVPVIEILLRGDKNLPESFV